MENKKVIMILVAIVIILVGALGVIVLQANAKEPTHITVTQVDENDDNIFSIQVLDSNDNLIENGTFNYTVTAENGSKVFDAVDVPLVYGDGGNFDLDLEKGNYTINVDYSGYGKYDESSVETTLNISKVTETYTIDEILAEDYPSYSTVFGYYRTVQTQQEIGLIETSNGNYYVLAGDGYYTFGGYDSQGNIQLGDYVGKY